MDKVKENSCTILRQKFDHEFQIEALCQSHQKELQQMLAEQALEHSASKTAHLYSKVNAQEVSTNVPISHPPLKPEVYR